MGLFKNRLTDGVPAALLACAVVWIGLLTAGPGDTTALAVCREVVAGTDQGRQALVGSCWFSPLVTSDGASACNETLLLRSTSTIP